MSEETKKELVGTGENKPERDEHGRLLPGNTANPNGRPRGSGISITTEIKRKLKECPTGERMTYLEGIIRRIMSKAINEGDGRMITTIWNYIDGMPGQKIELEADLTVDDRKLIDVIDNLPDDKQQKARILVAELFSIIDGAKGDNTES